MKTSSKLIALIGILSLLALPALGLSQVMKFKGPPLFTICTIPDACKEIGITPEQQKQIDKILEEVVVDVDGRKGIRITQDTDLDQLDKDVLKTLKPDQAQRAEELWLQRIGLTALAYEKIAKKVGITKDQQGKIDAILDEQQEEMMNLFSSGGGDHVKITGDAEKLREKYSKKLSEALTKDQRDKWAKMLGKKFEFKKGQ